jgi:hypothetical protein
VVQDGALWRDRGGTPIWNRPGTIKEKCMGAVKEAWLQQEDMRGIAEQVAIAAGLGERCEMHSDVFMSEFPDEDLLVEAYKIANARITKGEIELPSMMSRRDFTDLIKEVVENAPDFCPECQRLFGKDD